jgi:pilus assembly protein CpaB
MKPARLIVLVLALAAGAVAAWLASGGRRPDHVDVVLTQKLNGNQGFKSQIILSNVRVLAVDQVLGEKDGQKVIVGKTATIEADPQQATILANARQLGTLSLALRSLLDSQTTASDANNAAGNDDALVVIRYGISASR